MWYENTSYHFSFSNYIFNNGATPGVWGFVVNITLTLTRGLSHCGLAIYTKKSLKATRKFWKFKYFTMQKYNLQKKSSTRDQNPARYHNSITNLKFQHKPKYHLSKILI